LEVKTIKIDNNEGCENDGDDRYPPQHVPKRKRNINEGKYEDRGGLETKVTK